MDLKIVLSIIILLASSNALAATSSEDSIEADKNIDKIIKERSYPGGVDEEPLKVVKELKNPYSKESFKSIRKQVYESLSKQQDEEDSKSE